MKHIIPFAEIDQHEQCSTCSCCPMYVGNTDDGEDMVFAHQSFSGLELIQAGFRKGALMGHTSRDGRELIEGDVVESLRGEKYLCTTKFDGIPSMMKPNGQFFHIIPAVNKIWFIGNIFEDLQLRHDFLIERGDVFR